jgi:peptide/nickel transport system substrate-binding protein
MFEPRRAAGVVLAAIALVSVAPSAFAQKSADTVRFPMTEPVPVISGYYSLGRENNFFLTSVHESLIMHDMKSGKFSPQLAKSFRRIDPLTLEFELRDDVVFHNGEKMDADDVVATFTFATDRKNGIQLPDRFSWIKSVEKLGPYKVRIVADAPSAVDISQLTQGYILNKTYLESLKDPKDYGRAPVGTGPYRIAMFDDNKGILAVKNEHYAHGLDTKKPRLGSFLALPIHDKDTQQLNLLTGKIDVIRDPSEDQLKEFAKNGQFATSSLPAMYMTYMMFDAAGLSGKVEMKDKRVREAMIMAIDREALRKTVVAGGDAAKLMDAMCFREMIACDFTTKPYPYDPAAAKKLLAEAGYPNGFEVELTSRPATKDAAVAVTGYWRAVGIKATIDQVTINGWRNKRNSGKVQAYFGERPMDDPDVSYAVSVLFSPKRDYSGDDAVTAIFDAGPAELDEAKRASLYRAVFDRVNTEGYMLPMTTLPQTFIHVKDLAVEAAPETPYTVNVGVFRWK